MHYAKTFIRHATTGAYEKKECDEGEIKQRGQCKRKASHVLMMIF